MFAILFAAPPVFFHQPLNVFVVQQSPQPTVLLLVLFQFGENLIEIKLRC